MLFLSKLFPKRVLLPPKPKYIKENLTETSLDNLVFDETSHPKPFLERVKFLPRPVYWSYLTFSELSPLECNLASETWTPPRTERMHGNVSFVQSSLLKCYLLIMMPHWSSSLGVVLSLEMFIIIDTIAHMFLLFRDLVIITFATNPLYHLYVRT